MAEHYTDEDVRVAYDAWDGQPAIPGNRDSIRAVLDAVAPAIAARREAQVLREASERYAKFPRPDSGLIPKEWADGFMDALDGVADDLLRRADEIEGR